MESDNIEDDCNSKEQYVFLDFNGKLSDDVFQNEVFLKIANLHKNPLVQVNDTVYKGRHDHSVGTNLFFEEIEDSHPVEDAFEKQTPIELKHILSETKILSLNPVKIPQKKVNVPNEGKKINFNLDWDYNELLEKFENGTLKIEDIVKKEQWSEIALEVMEVDNVDGAYVKNKMDVQEIGDDQNLEKDEVTLDSIIPKSILEYEYEKLIVLARRPVKRVTYPELVAETEGKYKEAYEYHNIERQILQPSDAFRNEEVTDVNEDTLSNNVDIDRCILYDLLSPSSVYPRVLSKQEKQKVLSLENFDNLSLPARYYVLKCQVGELENYVKSASESELKEDQFGRTPLQTLEIYKKLTEAVRNRIQEIKYSLQDLG